MPINSVESPLYSNSSLTLSKYVSSGYPKLDVPPDGDVLWWIPCHTTTFYYPVVIDVPTLNVNFRRNASANNVKISTPSLLFGKNAVLWVPLKWTPSLFVPLLI